MRFARNAALAITMTIATIGAAHGDVLTLQESELHPELSTVPANGYSTTPNVPIKSAYPPPEFSAAGRVDYMGDGYIGTMRDWDVVTFDTQTPATVPEPATLVLVGTGLALAGLRSRRRPI